ncbi:MAG: HEPN domain-containing protein [Lachnospiraceae bacterium]|nr:HEPN domain-containing protein [Lachnospiraceae bacterium]MEE0686676.1 HEPN domain-containing protein [Lachnospiraceae bacterium]MEE0861855.1 HEPN domain-containing protein [Lachnospiraceae bacterium]
MKQHNDNVGTVKDLVIHRIETAKSDIHSAEILLNAGEYRSSNNRAYYGIYHAISAIHALDGNSYRKHKDALANFNKEYVKTEIFPRNIGKRISEAEEIRHASDYDDFYIATKVEAEEQIATAKELLELVSQYCENKFASSKKDE